MQQHEPECPMSLPAQSPMDFHLDFPQDCICVALRAAYRRGYNDHAASASHWEATHGAYREPAWPFAGTDAYNQHGAGENP